MIKWPVHASTGCPHEHSQAKNYKKNYCEEYKFLSIGVSEVTSDIERSG